MAKWICLCDIDNTVAKSDLRIHPRNQAEWMRRLGRNLPVVQSARAHLARISELADIAFVTSRPAFAEEKTRAWLRRNLPHLPFVALHLCPVGAESSDHKAKTAARYHNLRSGCVVSIDDAPYRTPHMFRAPTEWDALIAFLEARNV